MIDLEKEEHAGRERPAMLIAYFIDALISHHELNTSVTNPGSLIKY